jgi:endo-1,4-beta-xylanase
VQAIHDVRLCFATSNDGEKVTRLMPMALSRRRFVRMAAAAVMGAETRAQNATAVPADHADASSELRTLAQARNIVFGAAAVSRVLQSDPAMAAIYMQQAAMIVPDYEMKWGVIRPSEATYNYVGADALAQFAAAHGLKLRGHCLAWEESNPAWLATTVTPANAERILVDHITRTVGRYAGRIHSWDVVNEPIWPDHRKPGGLRDGVWLRALGPRYIDIAFRAARAADPKALLVLNEAGTEVTDSLGRRRRQDFLALLDRLRQDQVPVDAVGLECHLSTKSAVEPGDFANYLAALAGRGFKILITELDVSDYDEPSSDIAVRDRAVAAIYRTVVSAAVQQPAVVAMLTWELADKYSWLRDRNLSPRYRRTDGAPQRPLPYDDRLQKKPCWSTMAHTLASAS